MTSLRGMFLLIALSQLVVTTHSKRLAYGMSKLQKDSGPSSPSSPTNDLTHAGVEEVFNKVMSDEKTTEESRLHAQMQMGIYKELVAAFSEADAEIHFAPSSTAKAEETLSTPKKADGNQYYEVPLYITSAKPICQKSESSEGVYKTYLTLTVRYDDIKALVVFFHVVEDLAANATLSQESIDDLAYIRHHLESSCTFASKSMFGSYDTKGFAAFTYRIFRLLFRSTPEVRSRIMRGALTGGLFNAAMIRSLESCPKQAKFVDPFVCSDRIDLAHILPAATPSQGLDSAALQKDLKIKFFDFNEETETKKDKLLPAYNALYDSMDGDEDVVVTCQTEAKSSAHKLMLDDRKWNDKWTLLGHGKHSGMTGINSYNAQILNVFVRKPTIENVETHRWPLDWDTKRDWVLDRKWNNEARRGTAAANMGGGADTLIEAASIGLADGTFLVSAKTRLHETSGDGKGGISTVLSYQSEPGKPRTRISLVCSHLDSETQSGREAGAEVILREATNFAARKRGKVENTPPEYPWREMIGLDSADNKDVDAIFVTGDLNYRLWYSPDQPLNDNAKMAPMIYTKAGRQKLASYDQLRQPEEGDVESVSVLTSTFGMQCNQPFESYLPTYKRRNKDACLVLGTPSKMDECGSLDLAACAQKCSSSDTAGCNACFTVQKTCESLALTCATGSLGIKEAEDVKYEVDSGTDLGIKTMVFQDPISSELQLWITDVEEGKWAAEQKMTPGEWMITAIKESDVAYYQKQKSKSPGKEKEKFTSSVKVPGLSQAADVQNKVVRVLDSLSTEMDGWKVKIAFKKPQSKWGLKEKQFLQMGWLDRLCWKTGPGSSATVSLISDVGLMDSKVSDHMPVHFAASVKRNGLSRG